MEKDKIEILFLFWQLNKGVLTSTPKNAGLSANSSRLSERFKTLLKSSVNKEKIYVRDWFSWTILEYLDQPCPLSTVWGETSSTDGILFLKKFTITHSFNAIFLTFSAYSACDFGNEYFWMPCFLQHCMQIQIFKEDTKELHN